VQSHCRALYVLDYCYILYIFLFFCCCCLFLFLFFFPVYICGIFRDSYTSWCVFTNQVLGFFGTKEGGQSPIQPGFKYHQEFVASLGSLFQCLTTLIVKNLFIIHNQSALSFHLKPLTHEYGLTCVIWCQRVYKKQLTTFSPSL